MPDRGTILAAVLAKFATVLALVETDPHRLRELHLARSLTVGRDVRVVVRASGVDEVLSAGDVTHLR
ncbi:MAG: hypothetical protein E6G39_03460 [Actinobacteria bacterium]|nr:MAG: hypothetical protein E6G39_03460 [Actinomycetota bacterium]